MRIRALVAAKSGGIYEKALRRLERKYPSVAADVGATCEDLLHNGGAWIPTGKRINMVPGFDGKLVKVRVPSTDQARGTSGGYRLLLFRVRGEEWKPILIYAKSESEDTSRSEVLRVIREES